MSKDSVLNAGRYLNSINTTTINKTTQSNSIPKQNISFVLKTLGNLLNVSQNGHLITDFDYQLLRLTFDWRNATVLETLPNFERT